MRRIALISAVLVAVSAGFAWLGSSEGWQSVFRVDKSRLTSSGSNPYFVLTPGHSLVYQRGNEIVTTTVLNETKVVDGVEARAVEDRETKDGRLVEVTRDYYAVDPATRDVYYFGEEVDVYKDGKVASHEGGWLSGVKDAKFGLMMPGTLKKGMKFYQELAPGIGMDRAELVGTGERVTTPAGVFENCAHFVETSPLERDAMDHKWYAPGIGCVKDADMPLVKIEKP
jgi:hypothetical protein